mgnify:FL=1
MWIVVCRLLLCVFAVNCVRDHGLKSAPHFAHYYLQLLLLLESETCIFLS